MLIEGHLSVSGRICILIIIDSIGVGGAESLLPTFLRHVDRDRFDVRVLALKRARPNHLHQKIHDTSTELIEWPARRMVSVRRIRHLIHRLRASPVHLVHSHLLYSNVLGTLAARRLGIPSIATLHNVYPSGARPSTALKSALETMVLRGSGTRVIAVAAEVERSYTHRVVGLSRSQITTIPNAIDLSSIEDVTPAEAAKARASVLNGAPGPLVLAVGRIAEQKGFVDLVRSAAYLAPRHPGLRIAIAGRDAGSGTELRSEIDRLGLESCVLLLGERNDVPALMNAADVFAISSHWEGAPIVLLEAMSAGLPIVATSVGGIPELIHDGGSGSLVPPRDPQALGAAIDELLRDRELAERYSARVRLDVQSYRAEAWARRIEAEYCTAIARQGTRSIA